MSTKRFIVTAAGMKPVTLIATIEAEDEDAARTEAEMLPESAWEESDSSFLSDITITDVDLEG